MTDLKICFRCFTIDDQFSTSGEGKKAVLGYLNRRSLRKNSGPCTDFGGNNMKAVTVIWR